MFRPSTTPRFPRRSSIPGSRTIPIVIPILALGATVLVTGCGRDHRERAARDAATDVQPDLPPYDASSPDRLSKACALDVLFVIDDSGSMAQEQANLAKNFKSMIEVLEDLPGGLPDVHIGVVSTNMGLGPYTGGGCRGDGGDKGMLRNEPRLDGCEMLPERYLISEDEGSLNNFDGLLTDAFACIATLGVSGCGFEQPLSALQAALDGSNPENDGFLRPDADLAVILITDEDDCSARSDYELFNPAGAGCGTTYGPLQGYRCTEFGILCEGAPPPAACSDGTVMLADCQSNETGKLLAVKESADFLKSLKEDTGARVIAAALAGTPEPVTIRGLMSGELPYGSELMPSCMSPTTGEAFPAVRLKQFIDEFGERGLFESICSEDFSPAMKKIGELIRSNLGSLGKC